MGIALACPSLCIRDVCRAPAEMLKRQICSHVAPGVPDASALKHLSRRRSERRVRVVGLQAPLVCAAFSTAPTYANNPSTHSKNRMVNAKL